MILISFFFIFLFRWKILGHPRNVKDLIPGERRRIYFPEAWED